MGFNLKWTLRKEVTEYRQRCDELRVAKERCDRTIENRASKELEENCVKNLKGSLETSCLLDEHRLSFDEDKNNTLGQLNAGDADAQQDCEVARAVLFI
uniref:Tektin n=1 Tax=Steinernema glaseri TaxID=37863 RepID=A0A1I7YQ39_9BILA